MTPPFLPVVVPVHYARWAWGLAAIFAAAIAYDLMRMPIQVYDSLGELLAAQASPSAWQSFVNAASSDAYFRPLRIAQIKLLFDLSEGHYALVYRGWHALLICAAFTLFVRGLRVSSRNDFAAAAFALVVFIGGHTFSGLVREAFPVNHFLEIVVACLAAVNLAQSRGGWVVDALAIAVFTCAMLTVESGVLVWVVVMSARAVGLQGVSRAGAAAMTAFLMVYLGARLWLDVGTPALSERSSGFGLQVLEPSQLEERFGDTPLLFYAYNVTTSILSIFLTEPQNGVFVAVRGWLNGSVPARVLLGMASAVPTTALIAWVAHRTWRHRQVLSPSGRLLAVSLAVIGANAVVSYGYSKNEIVSVAGTFYAVAAFAGVVVALERCRTAGLAVRAGVAVLLLVAGTAWAVRSLGIHYLLNLQAARHRFDWAVLPVVANPVGAATSNPRSVELMQTLRNAALDARVPGPRYYPQWTQDLWGD